MWLVSEQQSSRVLSCGTICERASFSTPDQRMVRRPSLQDHVSMGKMSRTSCRKARLAPHQRCATGKMAAPQSKRRTLSFSLAERPCLPMDFAGTLQLTRCLVVTVIVTQLHRSLCTAQVEQVHRRQKIAADPPCAKSQSSSERPSGNA